VPAPKLFLVSDKDIKCTSKELKQREIFGVRCVRHIVGEVTTRVVLKRKMKQKYRNLNDIFLIIDINY